MIKNDRQLSVAHSRVDQLREAAARASAWEQETYEDLARTLEEEIEEYESVREGRVTQFPIRSLDDLDGVLIKARIARGLTQRALAERLGVSEQMVQRDEMRGYGQAKLSRIADIADALDYVLEGVFRPREAPPTWIHLTPVGTHWPSPEGQSGTTVSTHRLTSVSSQH